MPNPPKSIEQHKMEGTYRADRHGDGVALLVAGRPELEDLRDPPAHLPKEAKGFWQSTILKLVDVGIADKVDIPALEQLATQYARIRFAQAVIAEDGMFSRGSMGQIKEHPAIKIEREATLLWFRLAQEYALTPVARTRLGLAELHRRSIASEMDDKLGGDEVFDIDGDFEDAEIVG